MRYVFLILGLIQLFGAVAAHGADSWLCTEESSVRNGNLITACGVGVDPDEGKARLKAFDAAKEEFQKVCLASPTCSNKGFISTPKRTSCEGQKAGTYKCYRAVEFELQEVSGPMVALGLKDDLAEPTVKIRKGLAKDSLIQSFGEPHSVVSVANYEDEAEKYQIFYKGDMCKFSSSLCYVVVKNDKVTEVQGFKVKFIGF